MTYPKRIWVALVLAASACTGVDAGGNASTASGATVQTQPCNPAMDNVRCNGKKVSYCTCTTPVTCDDGGWGVHCTCDAYSWVDGDVCAVACDTAINPTNGCIASEQPVPECADVCMTTCWNGNRTACSKGYPLPTTPCAAGTQCTLVPGCEAVCLSPSATKDPRCPATPGISGLCLDNAAYFCSCGYLTQTIACGAPPNSCVGAPFYDGCSKTSGQTAMCGLPP
jgi:hypothetical protein